MKVGSLFAGIGGFDLGFERAGFEVTWCVEWDKNAQAVLRKRFPNAQVYGDIREVDPDKLERVDVICGGFPCQDLSVAGKRAGLAGERSGLFHDAMRIVRQLRPSVLILENVPGLLSSNRGLDFATVLREVGEGWDCQEVAWRVLDSRYFGVAQRRRRVFVVAGSRAGCAEQILALAEGGGGNRPSRDKAREGTPSDAGEGFENPSIVPALTSKMAKGTGGPSGDECQNLVVGTIDCDIPKQRVQNFCAGHWIPCAIQGNLIGRDAGGPQGIGVSDSGTMYTMTKTDVHGVAFRKSRRAQSVDDHETWVEDETANTLNGFDTGDTRTTHAVAHGFYSTGGTHGLEPQSNICPPIKVGSALGIPSPPAVAYTIDMQGCKGHANVGDGTLSPTLGRPSGTDCHAVAVDVYNQTVDGDCAATVTAATGGTNTSGPKVMQPAAIAFDWQKGNDVGNPRPSTMNIAEEHSQTLGTTRVPAVAFSCKEDASDASDIAPTMRAMSHDQSHANGGGQLAIAFKPGASAEDVKAFTCSEQSNSFAWEKPEYPTITAKIHSDTSNLQQGVRCGMVVRRLTPVECERLQGFPDGWTQVGTDKPTADSHRYKQLGNAVTVNVAEWIARRTMAWLT